MKSIMIRLKVDEAEELEKVLNELDIKASSKAFIRCMTEYRELKKEVRLLREKLEESEDKSKDYEDKLKFISKTFEFLKNPIKKDTPDIYDL